MKYLLDTYVISELIKKIPDQKVVEWVASREESRLFLSVLTFGEIHKGIEKMPISKKKKMLHNWVEVELLKKVTDLFFNLGGYPFSSRKTSTIVTVHRYMQHLKSCNLL